MKLRSLRPARIAMVVLVPFAIGMVSCGGNDEASTAAVAETMVETSVDDVAAPAETFLIDVRDMEEFASGHIPEAINIPFNDGTLAAEILNLDPNAAYSVYCRSGNRSGQAVALMRDAGFTNVVDLGGLEAAVSSTGLELVTE